MTAICRTLGSHRIHQGHPVRQTTGYTKVTQCDKRLRVVRCGFRPCYLDARERKRRERERIETERRQGEGKRAPTLATCVPLHAVKLYIDASFPALSKLSVEKPAHRVRPGGRERDTQRFALRVCAVHSPISTPPRQQGATWWEL